MARNKAIAVFLAFALAYFLSALIRSITATLSPTLVTEFGMSSKDLGLLAGAYFLGFSLTQLPLGTWLDRFGPKKVLLSFLCVAVLGSWCFSVANQFATLWIARMLTGVGVTACLMAPLTAYRRWFEPAHQLRSNAWMLMTGSLGMVASTLPVQWLVPVVGWRPLFVGLGLLIVVAMAMIAWVVPRWERAQPTDATAAQGRAMGDEPQGLAGYKVVFFNPYFQRHLLVGMFVYGGFVAMQTLWAVPWMVKVAGYSPLAAAQGLFALNVCMMLAFWCWGLFGPWLALRGWGVDRLITRVLPVSFGLLALLVFSPVTPVLAGVPSWVWWAAYCVSCTVVAGAQPAVAMVFPSALAGRALSAYNLLIFMGVFFVQWGVGALIDGLKGAGWSDVASHQGAIAIYGIVGCLAYLRFMLARTAGVSR